MCQKTLELVVTKIKEVENCDPVFDPSKPKPCYRSLYLIFTTSVFIASTIGAIILWGTDTWYIGVLKVLTFEENGMIFKVWEKPQLDTIIKIYPFNYTNIDNIGNERLHVEETGPYVFRERVEKLNVVFNNNGTLTYSENRTHEFDGQASKGTLEDVIYTPNVPFMSAAANGAKTNLFSQLALAAVLKSLDTRLFLPVDVERFAMGFDDSFSVVARKLASLLRGMNPPKFGLLSSRNGLSPDRVTIGTGVPDLQTVGIVSAYNGESSLTYWDTEECNDIRGSDGGIFPGQLVRNGSQLYIYVKNFCRKIPIKFSGLEHEVQGLPAKRYELPHNVFDSAEENPENSCYCSGSDCAPSGTFSSSVCTFGSPVLISFPHFLHGDPELRENITGLKPDDEKHNFYLDLHETLGFPVGGNSRFQLNVMVHHCPFLSQLNKIPSGTILPIAWVDVEFGEIKGNLKDMFYHATYTAEYINLALSWTSLLVMLTSAWQLIVLIVNRR